MAALNRRRQRCSGHSKAGLGLNCVRCVSVCLLSCQSSSVSVVYICLRVSELLLGCFTFSLSPSIYSVEQSNSRRAGIRRREGLLKRRCCHCYISAAAVYCNEKCCACLHLCRCLCHQCLCDAPPASAPPLHQQQTYQRIVLVYDVPIANLIIFSISGDDDQLFTTFVIRFYFSFSSFSFSIFCHFLFPLCTRGNCISVAHQRATQAVSASAHQLSSLTYLYH